MADYYPLVARAVAALDPNAPGESRRALYERARSALIAQLRSVQPPLKEVEVVRERLSLEEAIRRVESEAAQRAREYARGHRREHSAQDDEASQISELARLNEQAAKVQALAATLSRQPNPRSLPPITAIPEQNEKRAIAFRPSRRGPLDLALDPPKDPFDPEQSQLYSRIRQQLRKLKEDLPSQERSQIDAAVDDFLAQPEAWQQVEFKKVLWLCGNSLRSTLAQHDAVKHSPDPHYSKLPPSVAEAMRRPVEAWNVFVLGDPDFVELDAKRLGPREQQSILNDINAAKPIVETAAADRSITTEQAGKVLNAGLSAATVLGDDINTKQAQDLVAETSKNLIIQLIRRAYQTCQSLADPKTDEDRAIVAEYKKGIAQGAGVATLGAIVATTTHAAPHAASFFEFVIQHALPMKQYIAVAFQNPQLGQVIDAIEYVRARLNNEQP